jgi:hypothetical protein
MGRTWILRPHPTLGSPTEQPISCDIWCGYLNHAFKSSCLGRLAFVIANKDSLHQETLKSAILTYLQIGSSTFHSRPDFNLKSRRHPIGSVWSFQTGLQRSERHRTAASSSPCLTKSVGQAVHEAEMGDRAGVEISQPRQKPTCFNRDRRWSSAGKPSRQNMSHPSS